MMMIECAPPGAWSRVFTEPNTKMYDEPTVHGVDYPLIGIRRTHHDSVRRGILEVDTYAATPSRRGTPTTFTVDNLPHDATISLQVDSRPHATWRRIQPDAVEIDLDIDITTRSLDLLGHRTDPDALPLNRRRRGAGALYRPPIRSSPSRGTRTR